MKELSIEEKAKRYDELKVTAQELEHDGCFDKITLFDLFPELKESEDEKIRKDIISFINGSRFAVPDAGERVEMITWLEKQGEQKIDDDDKAILENWESIVKDNKEKWQLSDWFVEATLLLVQKIEQIGFPKSIVDNNKTMLNACINTLRNVGHSRLAVWLEKQGEQKPAFEMKTPEESLDVDSDTYNKIVDECIYGEQKPADKFEPKFKVGDKIQYSKGCGTIMTIEKIENDEYIFANNLGHTTIEDGNKWYLVENNPTWSEEDEIGLCDALWCIKQASRIAKDENEMGNCRYAENWLKFLKERYTWKPSDEQMLAINTAINVLGKGTLNGKQLIELQEQLKRLREE